MVISFGLAALASAFSALCYAEFAGRVPRAGSAYAYSYITVGEFIAFVIGWNLILEYVIGAASVARGFSGYLSYVAQQVARPLGFLVAPEPQLANGQYSDHHNSSIHTNSSHHLIIEHSISGNSNEHTFVGAICAYLVQYFDWPSIVIVLVVTIFILFGVKESTNVTLFFTSINLSVVVVVLFSSLKHLDIHNWNLAKSEVPVGFGEGGFLPYGWSGVLAGSATCFFGFIGFDTIASSAEESKHPRRNVPLSILLSLFLSFLTYMAIAIVQTLLWPYYDQNKVTILPLIFSKLDMPITYWIVLVGAIAGLASSQLAGSYPLPRILYSMAHDKLIYNFMAKIDKRLKLPVRATIIGSVFVALLSCLLDIQDLTDMVSLGTLAAYSLVSLSVLILRYEKRSDAVDDSTLLSNRLSFTDIIGHSPTGGGLHSAMADSSKCSPATANKQPESRSGADDFELRSKEGAKVESNRPKLTAKPSTPIREKGSRAVVAQLSVGFHSWFKAEELPAECQANGQNGQQGKGQAKNGQPGLLDLLISWRADDQWQNRAPDQESSRQSKILISLLVALTILLDFIALRLCRDTSSPVAGYVGSQVALSCTGSIMLVVLVALMLMLSRLPTCSQYDHSEMFQVPLVPLIPMLSILVNTFLMLNLSYLTWVRFTVWMAAGLFIYFTYGIWKSEGYMLHLER